jgi:glycosyltransferase involved in cell wall biosynthesis
MDVTAMKSSQRPIRVLHLIDSLDLGGAQTALIGWLKYHNRSAFAVELATFHGTDKSLFIERARELKIPVHLLSPRKWLPIYLIRLPILLARKKYAVVHCHLFASNWIGKPLAKLFGVRLVVSHDHCNDRLREESWLARVVDRATNRCADKVIVVAGSIKDFLISREGLPAVKIRVMPNGISESPLVTWRPTANFVIGGAGRLTRQKNFFKFLQIARALKMLDERYSFQIAGSGPLESELRDYAQSLRLDVQWLGALPSLDDFYANIHLFLLTSDFEGLPVVLLESLQRGVPTAATAVDGVMDQLKDNVLLLPLDATPEHCAESIHRFLSDPERISRWIEDGRELIRKKFSAEHEMIEIEELYNDFLRGSEANAVG